MIAHLWSLFKSVVFNFFLIRKIKKWKPEFAENILPKEGDEFYWCSTYNLALDEHSENLKKIPSKFEPKNYPADYFKKQPV